MPKIKETTLFELREIIFTKWDGNSEEWYGNMPVRLSLPKKDDTESVTFIGAVNAEICKDSKTGKPYINIFHTGDVEVEK